MSDNVIQNSFSSGELAPTLYARTDLAAYHSGLATCRNFFVDYRSGVTSRSGTRFVIQAFKSSTAVRLIGFSVSVTSTYVIEFGDYYCRFINNGAPVLESSFSVSSITNGLPGAVTAAGNNFNPGDWVFLTGTNGMPALNGRFAVVTGPSGGTFALYDVNGNPIDTSTFGTYTGGATVARVYTISSPYAAADLQTLKFVESVSVLYLTHPSYPPYTLSFFAPTNWVFAQIQFGTNLTAPTGLTASQTMATPTPTNPTNTNYAYVVTTVDANGQESLPSAPFYLNNQTGSIAVNAGTVLLTWNPVTGAISYNVYKAEISYSGQVPSGVAFGFIGNVASVGVVGGGGGPPGMSIGSGPAGTSFTDSNIVPDFATTPPFANSMPFANGNNPSVVTFFQQRAYYAATTTQPATFWASQPGSFNNFNFSDPIQDDDEINGTIVSTQLNSILWMLPMPGGLIMLTGRAAFTLSTGQGANATLAVTPTNATIVPQAYNGSANVPPIVVNEDILYVQAKGAIVRDLSYNIYAAIYTGTDISIKSNHLFFGHQLIQWTWAEEPFKIVWAVRDDGVLLSLTFMKEQQMIGWARHDTNGLFKSVTSVQEGQVDAPYFVVQRQLPNGRFVQFIERMQERLFTYGAEDSWRVDAGEQSSLPTPAAGITITGASGSVSISADAAVFSSGSVGQVLRAGGGIISITSFTSPTQISGTVTQTITQVIPETGIPQPFASGTWSIATPAKKFYGYDYLAGQTVKILADGGVVPDQVVAADGSITLASPATKVVAGFGIQAQGKTMPLDTGEPTIQGKRKKIGPLNLKLVNTRGLKWGRTFQTLVAMKDMNISVPLGSPIALVSGEARIIPDALWDVPGQICWQLDDPLPAHILAIIPEPVIGDTNERSR